jgi:hypothetical protein
MAKLKVFRTPIGFHDAYIAAPSQKAALAAWGADSNLFARGVAEQVTDPGLSKEPLEQPGTVIKRLRGSAAEHIAALPRERTAKAATPKPSPKSDAKRVRARKPKPPPSRAALDAAEKDLSELTARHKAEKARLAKAEARLAEERRALDHAQAAEAATLEQKIARTRRDHDRAMAKWRGREN